MAYTTAAEVSGWLEDVAKEKAARADLRRRVDGVRVQRWGLDGADDLAELGLRILKSAERDGLGQPQKFVSYNLRAEETQPGDEDGLGTLTITVPGAHAGGKAGDVAGYDDNGPANFAGLVMHVTKQNAELHRLLLASHEGRTVALERQIEQLRGLNEDSSKRHITLLTLTDSLAIAKLEKETMLRREELDEKRHKYAADKLDRYLPIALNRLMGGGPGKGAPMADEILQELLGKMDGERLESLMSGEAIALTEDERMLFAEIYASQAAKHRARESRSRPINQAKEANGVAAADGDGKEKPS